MTFEPKGLRVAVVGAGVSGVAASGLLADRGARVLLSDSRPESALADRLGDVDPRVGVVCGRNDLGDATLVVASPGVPPGSPVLRQAAAAGLPVWSEPELAFRLCPGPVLAITGTDGKSTVTVLLGHLLREAGRETWVGGNLGTPLCAGLLRGEVGRQTRVVLEVSCFQLLFVHRFRARVAVLLNVAEDHLDVHGSLDDYAAAKARVFERQAEGDTAVYNAEDGRCAAPARAAAVARGVTPVPFGLHGPQPTGWSVHDGSLCRADAGGSPRAVLPRAALPLIGDHNVANALAAAAAAWADGADEGAIARGLRSFSPLPHRVEQVVTRDGVRWVDDSKATNAHAAAAGLVALGAGPVVLLAGGVDKGLDLAPLVEAAAGRVRAAFVFGEIRARMAEALALSVPSVEVVEDLAAAVAGARRAAGTGDTVLLGPACSSFDQFSGYAERGRAFQRLAREGWAG